MQRCALVTLGPALLTWLKCRRERPHCSGMHLIASPDQVDREFLLRLSRQVGGDVAPDVILSDRIDVAECPLSHDLGTLATIRNNEPCRLSRAGLSDIVLEAVNSLGAGRQHVQVLG